jgi:O-antigen ligase
MRRQANKGTRAEIVSLSPYLLVILSLVVLALALLPLHTLTLIIFYGFLVILPLLDPVFGLYWAILSVPVQELVRLPGGLSYTQAAMVLAATAWGLRVLAHPERSITPNGRSGIGRQVWLWTAFLWALMLSAAFSPYSRSEGIKETLRWLETFLVWLMVVVLARRPWQIAGLIVCLLAAPAAEAVIGIVQFLTGTGPPSFRISPNLQYVRAYGTIGQPNSFAGYLNMAWPLALALAFAATRAIWRSDDRRPALGERVDGGAIRRRNDINSPTHPLAHSPARPAIVSLVLWTIAVLLLAAVVASLSRGAWFGAACGAGGMALALGRRSRRVALAGLGLGALGLGLGGAGLLPGLLADRLASVARYLALFDAGKVTVTPQNFALVERMAQMQAGWRMFLAHPLTGVGPGNFTPAYPAFAVGTWYASRGHAHNYYIHIAAETGLIGALAYLALLAGVAYQAIATLRRANSTVWRSVAIGCCGIIAAVAGHDLFENLHVLSMGVQLAGVWGLLVVLGDVGQPERVNG